NANVEAALNDPSVKPWTRLDTRRLSARQRLAEPDEVAHVLAPAYLADGVADPKREGSEEDGTTRFTGRVDPALLARRVPPAIADRPSTLNGRRKAVAGIRTSSSSESTGGTSTPSTGATYRSTSGSYVRHARTDERARATAPGSTVCACSSFARTFSPYSAAR